MAGIYIHIPYCRQKCIYCNFHFSTNKSGLAEMLAAMQLELRQRQNYASNQKIESIYFGGGTPSLLSAGQVNFLLKEIYNLHAVDANAEITLEANPDDLNLAKLQELKNAGINRLSIGVQSFNEQHLQILQRAHNAKQALQCLEDANTAGFTNLTLDLIYGLPGQTEAQWLQNLHILGAQKMPHFSAYALTVEPKTLLHKLVKQGKTKPATDEVAQQHFNMLMQWAAENNYVHYEISNFCRPGFYARHNTSYWQGKKYIGIGPSAHSFNGNSRRWNVSNNAIYIKNINAGLPYFEEETLSLQDQYNEFVMTGLRTIWGCKIQDVNNKFGMLYAEHLLQQAQPFIKRGFLVLKDETLTLSAQGKFLADGIIADLFHI